MNSTQANKELRKIASQQMSLDEYDEIAHLLKFDDSFPACLSRVFDDNFDPMRRSYRQGRTQKTLRQVMTTLLARQRTENDAKSLLKGCGKDNPPNAALEALAKECPTWTADFESRIHFIAAFDLFCTYRNLFVDALAMWSGKWDGLVLKDDTPLERAFTGCFHPHFQGIKASFDSFTSRFLCANHFMVEGLGRLHAAVVTTHTIAVENRKQAKHPARAKGSVFKLTIDPRRSAGDIHRVDLLVNGRGNVEVFQEDQEETRKRMILVGMIFPTGEAVFRNGTESLAVFLLNLAVNPDGIDHVFKNVCRCIFCARPITTENSQQQGAGDICYARFGTPWKQATFQPVTLPHIRQTISASSDTVEFGDVRIPKVLVQVSPVLSMFAEGDEDVSEELVQSVMAQGFSENDLGTLAEYVMRFTVYKSRLGDDKYWIIYRDHVRMSDGYPKNAHIEAVTSRVKPTAYRRNDDLCRAFLYTKMLTPSMVKLVHYLDIRPVWIEIRNVLRKYWVGSFFRKHVDMSRSQGSRPEPFYKEVDEKEIQEVVVPRRPVPASKFYEDSDQGKTDRNDARKVFYQARWNEGERTPYHELYTPGMQEGSFQRVYLRKRWKEMSKDAKRPFEERAKRDKDRYKQEMEHFDPPEGHPLSKKKRQGESLETSSKKKK